jgi:6-phosphogluconolactonase
LLAENQDSNNIVAFRIDQETGKLTPAGQTVEVGAPVCIQFVPVR